MLRYSFHWGGLLACGAVDSRRRGAPEGWSERERERERERDRARESERGGQWVRYGDLRPLETVTLSFKRWENRCGISILITQAQVQESLLLSFLQH
jgi:hypothetical protein